MSEEAAHSLFSASKAHCWTRCYGSLALTKDAPRTSSEAADEGTAAHELASWCLQSTTSPDAEAFLGRRIDVGHRTFEVTKDMAAHVNRYVQTVLALAEGHELLVEQRVDYSRYLGCDLGDGFGTSDTVILREDGELIIVDLKYGANPRNKVDAEDNEQLMLYALGAYDSFSVLGDFDRVRMMIVQPRLEHVSEWTQTVKELKAWAVKAHMAADHSRAIIARGEPTLAELTPGDKQCHWCPAKATCPGLTKLAFDTVSDGFVDLDAPKPALELSAHAVDVKAIDNERLGAIGKSLDLIEGWCKAARGRIEGELLGGNAVPGFKLVEGRKGARSWSDPAEAEAMLKGFRLKVEEMFDLSLISPTTAEKLAKAETIGPRQWAKAQALIVQKAGGPSVAPESDKRPPLQIAPVADAFSNLELEGADLV